MDPNRQEMKEVLKKESKKREIMPSSVRRINKGTFLVVQWLRICLPMQGTWF